ncbi:MAG: response regulator [Anaerolineae bacterium]|nr:response regulator [Anaerolineae bacterium]
MQKPIVLVVDDEEGIAKLLRIVVEMWGGEVYVASNRLEAIAYIQGMKPNLIILDIMMPGINGIELCEMMRQHENTKESYILVMSALGDIDTVGDVLNAGASDFWSKPIARNWMNKLRALLKQVVEGKNAEDAKADSTSEAK